MTRRGTCLEQTAPSLNLWSWTVHQGGAGWQGARFNIAAPMVSACNQQRMPPCCLCIMHAGPLPHLLVTLMSRLSTPDHGAHDLLNAAGQEVLLLGLTHRPCTAHAQASG